MAIDDNTLYGLKGSQLKDLPKKINAVKGAAKELTTDDYNYPTSNPDSVALWLLEPGVYYSKTNVYISRNNLYTTNVSSVAVVGEYDDGRKNVLSIEQPFNQNAKIVQETLNATTGSLVTDKMKTTLLTSASVVDSVTSTLTSNPLSANQGKVLNEKIESRVIQNAGAPTTSTVGTIGLLLEDTTNGQLYVCTNIDNTDPSNPVYTWKEVGSDTVKELTSADYNYPTDNPDGIAIWELSGGVYECVAGVKKYFSTTNSNEASGMVFVDEDEPSSMFFSGYNNGLYMYRTNRSGVIVSGWPKNVLTDMNVVQSTGISASDVMSQNAVTGMIFADPSVTHRVRIASTQVVGDHSTTVGEVAQGYGVGSTALGWGARVYGEAGVGIGREVDNVGSNYKGTVAIGAYSGAGITATGMMDIGTKNTTYGYNSSNYRLLTGLYDPQDDHDAANKEYVDNNFGKARVLTSDDYNWPTDNPDGVALWLLESGLYISQTNTSVYTKANNKVSDERTFIVGEETSSGFIPVVQINSSSAYYGSISASTGVPYVDYVALNTSITQTTGTSTTDVMSQNATTNMVYADPGTKIRVRIGDGAIASDNYTVAIGASAYAQGAGNIAIGNNAFTPSTGVRNSVALGYRAQATRTGEVNIGTGVDTTAGFNNSNYRVLGGVYDPQSEHDAANKQYVDNAVSDIGSISNNTLYL